MRETIDTLPKPKQGSSWVPGPLTPQEIESLQRDKQQAIKRFDELWLLDHPDDTKRAE